jgi:transcriptional regulator with XRE-family HTH domain
MSTSLSEGDAVPGAREFGDAVARCRNHRRMTQATLGSRVNLSQPQISGLERGDGVSTTN